MGNPAFLKVSIDVEGLKRKLSVAQGRQLPFAIARSLTATAMAIKDAEVEQIKKFDRPTPYTLNSLYVVRAETASVSRGRKERMYAVVGIKDKGYKGIAPIKYLGAEIEGGGRNLKRSEIALQRKGMLPAGQYIVPAKGVVLDRYGNVSGALMVRVLSALMAADGIGYTANRSDRSKRLNKKLRHFFTPQPGSKLTPGVWERTKTGIVPVLIFVKQPQYSIKLPFEKIARSVADKSFNTIFRHNFLNAMLTARPDKL